MVLFTAVFIVLEKTGASLDDIPSCAVGACPDIFYADAEMLPVNGDSRDICQIHTTS